MNLQSIIITNCIGTAMLVILLISSYLVRQRHQLSDKLFTYMIILTGASCLVEMWTFIIDGASFHGAKAAVLYGNTFLYLSNPTVAFLWCLYVDLRFYGDERRIKKYYELIAIPTLVSYFLVLLNIHTGWLFTVDKNNVYARQPAGYLMYLTPLLYLGYSVFLKYRYNRRYGKTHFFPIWMFLVPVLIGITMQMLVYGISLAWMSVALGLVGIYMSLQNELSYIDPLTKLYNRNYLDHMMKNLDRHSGSAGGLMIDIDYFKTINDRYGHSVGDNALVDAARLIRRAVPESAVTVRFAGDEFIVILDSDSLSGLDDTERSIREELEQFNSRKTRLYELSFSIGKSVFRSGIDTDRFLNAMDEDMYNEKREKHCRSTV